MARHHGLIVFWLVVVVVVGVARAADAETGFEIDSVHWDGRTARVSPDGSYVAYDAYEPDTYRPMIASFNVADGTRGFAGGPCSSPFPEEQACDWRFGPANSVVWLDRGTGTISVTSLDGGETTVLVSGLPVFHEHPVPVLVAVEPSGVTYSYAELPEDGGGRHHEFVRFDSGLSGTVAVNASRVTVADDVIVSWVGDDLWAFDTTSYASSAVEVDAILPLTGSFVSVVPGGDAVILSGLGGVHAVPLDGSAFTTLSATEGQIGRAEYVDGLVVYQVGDQVEVAPVDGSGAGVPLFTSSGDESAWRLTSDAVVFPQRDGLMAEGLYAVALDGTNLRYLSAAVPDTPVSDYLLSAQSPVVAMAFEDAPALVVSVQEAAPIFEVAGDIRRLHHVDEDSLTFLGQVNGSLQFLTAHVSNDTLVGLSRSAMPDVLEYGASFVYADSDTAVWLEGWSIYDNLWVTIARQAGSPPLASVPPGGTFADTNASVYAGWVEAIAAEGITAGCRISSYCPSTGVTRAQMATFLTRAFDLPVPANVDRFADVSSNNVHVSSIAAVGDAGVSLGCSPDGQLFCPEAPVTRAQMASFLARAMALAPTASGFEDVDPAGVHAQNIGAIQALQVSTGCDTSPFSGPGYFCPDSHVTRGQMAVFLGRALRFHPLFAASQLSGS